MEHNALNSKKASMAQLKQINAQISKCFSEAPWVCEKTQVGFNKINFW